MFHRQVLCVILLRVDKLQIESLCDHGDDDLDDELSKGLPEANALPAVEGQPRESASLLAARGAGKWVRWVEAIWKELVRSLPLLTVPVKAVNVDIQSSFCLDMKIANLCVLLELQG